MHRRVLALVLGAALLSAASPAPAEAGGVRQRVKRLLDRVNLRPKPGRRIRAPRGAGALGVGWLQMVHAAQVAQPGAHTIGLPRTVIELRAAPGTWGRQRKSQWCWAATSQMVLNYLGIAVSQEDVLLRRFGDLPDRPASSLEIAATLDGWVVPGPLGVSRIVRAAAVPGLTSDGIHASLAAGRPTLLALKNPDGQGGHAYVLTAMTYDVDGAGRIIGRTVTVRDPWPDSPSIQELSWDELGSRFMGAVQVDITQ